MTDTAAGPATSLAVRILLLDADDRALQNWQPDPAWPIPELPQSWDD